LASVSCKSALYTGKKKERKERENIAGRRARQVSLVKVLYRGEQRKIREKNRQKFGQCLW
jgi:hypothetical protein